MSNPYQISEISPLELQQRLANGDGPLLVDVREANELLMANLGEEVIHMPLSQLAARYFEAIPEEVAADKEREMVIFCHHGIRSAQVCAFLQANGWSQVINLDGGIDAYAAQVDPSIGFY